MALKDPHAAMALLSAIHKTEWAEGHLSRLDAEHEKYQTSNPQSLGLYDDPESEDYWMIHEIKPVPKEIGLLAGDFIASLRSSLDHLATALTMVGGRVASDHAAFPIALVDNNVSRSRFARSVEGMPASAIEVIRSLQPYNSEEPERSKLWKLHKLWNIDKHRGIPVRGVSSKFDVHRPKDIPVTLFQGQLTTMLRFAGGNDKNVYLMSYSPVVITFGEDLSVEGEGIPYPELRELYTYVKKEVVQPFKEFFLTD